MGIGIIEQARQHGVEKFTILGTICAYPKHTPVLFSENDLFDGYPEETNASYGIGKKALLTQSRAYRKQWDFNSIYLLSINLYGPRDDFDLETSHEIPAIIQKCVEARDREMTRSLPGAWRADPGVPVCEGRGGGSWMLQNAIICQIQSNSAVAKRFLSTNWSELLLKRLASIVLSNGTRRNLVGNHGGGWTHPEQRNDSIG